MANSETKTLALLNESLQISIIKKSTFDMCLKLLNSQGAEVRSDLLVEKINEVPLRTFGRVLAARNSGEMYKEKLHRVVKLIIVRYVRVLNLQRRSQG